MIETVLTWLDHRSLAEIALLFVAIYCIADLVFPRWPRGGRHG